MAKIDTLGSFNPLGQSPMLDQNRSVDKAKLLQEQGVKTEKEIEKAATGFEALLLHQMIKSMWSTVQSEGMMGEDSNQAQIYRDMFNQSIADEVAKGEGIGVKAFLRDELKSYSQASQLKKS